MVLPIESGPSRRTGHISRVSAKQDEVCVATCPISTHHVPVTQWLEYDAYNVGVDGSIPSRRTSHTIQYDFYRKPATDGSPD